ncbi:diphosphomevalonate decarboxylase [Contarinia nasturtii]|uniref:diphosphomevalonate decarboxylase n=1 Tax=Contarinia nasturtii TaxID=265458 RepID=UPI0012D4BE81|nr:diphosphomevalonate decarboxylase [Contarinia nasturtii]
MLTATCKAAPNIAVVKYWGKRDEQLILPVNDSISGTLSTDELSAKTSITADPTFTEDKMWLNGTEVTIWDNDRLKNCIEYLKKIAQEKLADKSILNYKLHICSENDFPTAAGLASSAAGYACFVYTLATLYGLENEELTGIARLGSGSACRSIYGGFVQWKSGELADGSDSIAVQIAPASHWPEMHVLILVVSDERKKVGSTVGMRLATETSELLNYRRNHCVPKHVEEITRAILNRDFPTFGEITMRESNQFHAICLDTYPPMIYMNDQSHCVSHFIHKYNEKAGEVKAAYTFDAGANACVYLLESEVAKFVSYLNAYFPNNIATNDEYIRGIPVQVNSLNESEIQSFGVVAPLAKNAFKYIIHTKVGEGPQRLDDSESLLTSDGNPKNLKS